jgi:hypothetical protein
MFKLFTNRFAIAGAAVAACAAMPAQTGQPTDYNYAVLLTISEVTGIGSEGPLGFNRPDIFVKVWIDGYRFTSPAVTPRTGSTIRPNWRFSRSIGSKLTAPIRIAAYDKNPRTEILQDLTYSESTQELAFKADWAHPKWTVKPPSGGAAGPWGGFEEQTLRDAGRGTRQDRSKTLAIKLKVTIQKTPR